MTRGPLQNQNWTVALEWSGHKQFSSQELAPWYAAGNGPERAGVFRAADNFAFATVDRSGHFVPYVNTFSSGHDHL